MSTKLTLEQLEKLDSNTLRALLLGLQDQLEVMNKNMELMAEQMALLN
jgi:ABC-type transporter Mla MlaB component